MEQGAGGREQGAGTREQGAGSREPEPARGGLGSGMQVSWEVWGLESF